MPPYRIPARLPRRAIIPPDGILNYRPTRLLILSEIPLLIAYSFYMYHCPPFYENNWYYYLSLWKIFLWICQSILIEHLIQESYTSLIQTIYLIVLVVNLRLVSYLCDLVWNYQILEAYPQLMLGYLCVMMGYFVYNTRIFYMSYRYVVEIAEEVDQREQ